MVFPCQTRSLLVMIKGHGCAGFRYNSNQERGAANHTWSSNDRIGLLVFHLKYVYSNNFVVSNMESIDPKN